MEENVKYDYGELVAKNVELENSVARLISENERLCNEINHVRQELLVYVQDTFPNAIKPSAKKVAVTPKNKVKKVRFAEPLTTSSNIKQVESSRTSYSNTHVLSPTGLKCSTSNCGSKPSGNKKNDRISQPPSRNMENKSQLNANSELICATCRTFTIVGNSYPLTRTTSANVVPPKKTISHSFESQKSELKFYSRKLKNVKNIGSSKKAKIVESKNANHSKPNHTWGSNATDIPSSASLVMIVRFGNDHIARIMGYGDYQLGNVTISRVYYVERLGHNLFFVGQFCDADLKSHFEKTLALFTLRAFYEMLESYIKHLLLALLNRMALSKVPVATAPRAVDLADSLVSTSSNQDAPSTSIPSTKEQEHSPISSQDTPMVEKSKLDEDLQGKPVDATQYHGMIGSLMYLTSSRPDLIHAVCLCARYDAKPIEKHLQEDQVENGIIELYFVQTEYQLADIFTKRLPRERFNFLIEKLADNRKISSARKEHMPYPRFTKVIINYFISKDNTISMRNRINLHTIHDDSLLGTLKFVAKTEDCQKYGALIPDVMINQNLKESKVVMTKMKMMMTMKKMIVIMMMVIMMMVVMIVKGLKDTDLTKQGREDQQNVSHESGFVQEEEDAHVTLTTVHDKTEGLLQISSISFDFTSKLLNLDDPYSYINSMMNTSTIPPPPPPINPFSHPTVIPQQPTPDSTKTTTYPTITLLEIPNFIEDYVIEYMGAEVLVRSTNQPQTSYAVATSLSEFELKKVLIDKMETNKSINRSNIQKNLYNALVESYNTNKYILSAYGDVVTLKRGRDDQDKDEDPFVRSERGTKRRKSSKDDEPSKGSKSKESKSSSSSKGTQSQHKSFDDQPDNKATPNHDWFPKPDKPPNPNRARNKSKSVDFRPPQKWISTIAKECYKERQRSYMFNELMGTPIDFSAFVMNRLKVNNMTQEILVGPAFNLLKGCVYPFDLSMPLPSIEVQRHQVVPANFFINNDLEYLKGESSSSKYATSTTRTKAAKYDNIKGKEDLVPTLWIPKSPHDVYSKRRIIAVTSVKVMRWYDYGYLQKIVVQRDDNVLSKFKEGDFPRLNLCDIEDMLLLPVQTKLSNHDVDDRYDLGGELYKFCDETLSSVQRVLHDIASNLEMDYLPKRHWSKLEMKRSCIMVKAIDKLFFERRLMHNLEKFVSGRDYENDLRLLERTI
uniref:Uncharacterized mitochondrial protein AtMg00810-like n=1 Tax=Tanacetum cinerariifolium TaxID=118510 RepID=A0A6L2L7F3_TANCI|nr:uncharacterized mitochondrial protein AtMg00810-like [Tanacetum cinerariifolium]